MSALIPALIGLLMSKRGGGGGGGGGGSKKPEKSQEEKSDYYWTKQILGGDIGDAEEKGRAESAKAYGSLGIKPYAKVEAEVRGGGR